MVIYHQITLESEDLDKLKELIINLPGDIEPVYPFIAHDENGEEITVTRDTRAGKNGRVITCPECNKASTVFHFAWAALLCRHCRAVVDKGNWITDVTFRGEVNV
tara:strand:+ start:448 stop:762 length:315 start_codon:yes stop_codon:yes gene_type:complete